MTLAIAVLTLNLVTLQEPTGTPKTSASQVLSKVLTHYAEAQSVSGSIKMTQSAQGVTINIVSDLQYERPSKIYLRQERLGSKAATWLLTSDGKIFSYDNPERILGGPRHRELVSQNGNDQKISDLYMAAEFSLGDLNPILDIAISHPSRLKRLKSQWATLKYQGQVKIGDVQVQKIAGDYREDATKAAAGTFEIYVNDAGDVVRYVTTQRFIFPSVSKEPVEVVTTWDSTVKVSGTINPALFKVVYP